INQSALGEISHKLAWNPRPPLNALIFYGVDIFGWLPPSGTTRILLLILALSISSLALFRRRVDWQQFMLPCAVAIMPRVILFVLAQYAPGSPWATRHLIGSSVFIVVLIAFGLKSFPRSWVGVGLGMALITWCALAAPGGMASATRIPWRSVVRTIGNDCPACRIATHEPVFVGP